jgi:hypothetical protein
LNWAAASPLEGERQRERERENSMSKFLSSKKIYEDCLSMKI